MRHDEFEINRRDDGLLTIRWRRARQTSVCRDRSWLALVTGLDAKYGLGRSFVSTSDHCGYRVALIAPGTYEYRGVYAYDGQSNYSYTKYGGVHGFFILAPDGSVKTTSKIEVLATLRNALSTTQSAGTAQRRDHRIEESDGQGARRVTGSRAQSHGEVTVDV
jgi:hypothetical protein